MWSGFSIPIGHTIGTFHQLKLLVLLTAALLPPSPVNGGFFNIFGDRQQKSNSSTSRWFMDGSGKMVFPAGMPSSLMKEYQSGTGVKVYDVIGLPRSEPRKGAASTPNLAPPPTYLFDPVVVFELARFLKKVMDSLDCSDTVVANNGEMRCNGIKDGDLAVGSNMFDLQHRSEKLRMTMYGETLLGLKEFIEEFARTMSKDTAIVTDKPLDVDKQDFVLFGAKLTVVTRPRSKEVKASSKLWGFRSNSETPFLYRHRRIEYVREATRWHAGSDGKPVVGTATLPMLAKELWTYILVYRLQEFCSTLLGPLWQRAKVAAAQLQSEVDYDNYDKSGVAEAAQRWWEELESSWVEPDGNYDSLKRNLLDGVGGPLHLSKLPFFHDGGGGGVEGPKITGSGARTTTVADQKQQEQDPQQQQCPVATTVVVTPWSKWRVSATACTTLERELEAESVRQVALDASSDGSADRLDAETTGAIARVMANQHGANEIPKEGRDLLLAAGGILGRRSKAKGRGKTSGAAALRVQMAALIDSALAFFRHRKSVTSAQEAAAQRALPKRGLITWFMANARGMGKGGRNEGWLTIFHALRRMFPTPTTSKPAAKRERAQLGGNAGRKEDEKNAKLPAKDNNTRWWQFWKSKPSDTKGTSGPTSLTTTAIDVGPQGGRRVGGGRRKRRRRRRKKREIILGLITLFLIGFAIYFIVGGIIHCLSSSSSNKAADSASIRPPPAPQSVSNQYFYPPPLPHHFGPAFPPPFPPPPGAFPPPPPGFGAPGGGARAREEDRGGSPGGYFPHGPHAGGGGGWGPSAYYAPHFGPYGVAHGAYGPWYGGGGGPPHGYYAPPPPPSGRRGRGRRADGLYVSSEDEDEEERRGPPPPPPPAS